MTHPPSGGTPPAGLLAGGPAGPPAPLPFPAGPPGQPGTPGQPPVGAAAPGGTGTPVEPPRRTAWAEGVDRLRAAATTEPGRLRLIGAVLAALVLAFGAVTAWQVSDRSAAAADVVGQSQPLSDDAASVYRSLADADTTAAAGFLSGGQWPAEIRERYETDIEVASELLVTAAANTEGSAASRRGVAELNSHLTAYTGLVEQARANNRQGLPLGGAYLRHANERMRTDLLPAARSLYEAETDRLGEDYADARSWPWAALALGVLALAALGWAQRRVYLRTNRVFNQGLLAATAACAVLLLWLAVGHGVARSGLGDSREHGAESLRVLNEARIHSLTARGDESLTLVARGARLTGNGKDFYETSYAGGMRDLVGGPGEEAAPGSLLDRAGDLADDTEGRAPVRAAVEAVRTWQDRHREARKADDNGDYDGALRQVIGDRGTTGESFDEVDSSLDRAQAHERREFRAAADGGRRAFAGLPAGAAVFALLGAAAAVLGIGRRLSEYR